MNKPGLYLAGPLGFSEVGRAFHNDVIVPMVREIGFEPLDPWVLTPQHLIDAVLALPYGPERREAWRKLNLILGKNNVDAIIRSQGLFAVLDGTDVDSGTAGEIAFGSALRKSTVGYRGDFRLAADNEGSLVNLQVEYFIFRNNGVITTTIQEARGALQGLYGQITKPPGC